MSESRSPVAVKKAASDAQARPAVKWSAKEMDSACYRLSRAPQKNKTKTFSGEKNESYAISYYKQNPEEVIDKNLPAVKLAEIEDFIRENEALEYKEKLSYLVKQKALTYIIYGENSFESFKSHYSIGFHYHHNDHPSSAIRHLQKARQLKEADGIKGEVEKDPNFSTMVDIETAESYYENAKKMMDQRESKRKEIQKDLSAGYSIISKVDSAQIAEFDLKYRAELLKARILNTQLQNQRAKEFYANAVNALMQLTGEESSEAIADLIAEQAANNEKAFAALPQTDALLAGNDDKIAFTKLYTSAYNMYVSLGLTKKTDAIQPKIDPDSTIECAEVVETKQKQQTEAPVPQEKEVKTEQNADNEKVIVPGTVYKPVTTDDRSSFKVQSPKTPKKTVEEPVEQEPPPKAGLKLGVDEKIKGLDDDIPPEKEEVEENHVDEEAFNVEENHVDEEAFNVEENHVDEEAFNAEEPHNEEIINDNNEEIVNDNNEDMGFNIDQNEAAFDVDAQNDDIVDQTGEQADTNFENEFEPDFN